MPRFFRYACALALLSGAAGAAAQDPQDTTRAVSLAPVTVTVLRTPLQLERVPYAVTVVTAEQIQRARPGLGLDEALRGVPGVQVDNRYNYALGERISIRGFGARAQFGVRGIRVLVDGIPATLPDGQTSLSHVDLGSLGRAEVIRGPAAALYGNTAGGVIQLETQPAPDRPLVQEVGVVTGSAGLLRLRSSTGGRSGGASYLVNVSRLDFDGYRTFSDARNTHVNARVGYAGRAGELRLLFSGVDYDARNPGTLSDSLLRVNRFQAFANNERQRTGEIGRQGQLGASWRHSLPIGALEVAAHGIRREIDNPIPNAIIDLDREASGARALLRGTPLASLAGFHWAVGVETERQRDDRLNFQNRRGERGNRTLDQLERVDNLAGFAQLGATPTPRLSLLAGLRLDRFLFRVQDRLVTSTNPDDSGRRRLSATSPSVGATYTLSDALGLYANWATSFETPTTTELANRPDGAGGFNPELEPQRARSVEAGARGRVGALLAYQLAAYHADVRDALIPFEVPQAAGRQFFRNAGSTTHRGVEAALTLSPLRGTQLLASYTYTDARFRDYVVRGRSFQGNRIPGVAPHRAEVGVLQRLGRGGYLGAEGRYASRLPVNDANSAHSPAHFVADLRAGVENWRLGAVEWEPFVGVSNLLDVRYNTSVVVNAFGGRFYEPGPGRALFAGARVRTGIL